MLRIGITGGIGSGKSTVCRVFEELGISVFYADAETNRMYANNSDLKTKIIAAFGLESYINDAYNRAYISNIVFNDKEKLLQLNAIVHPFVFDLYEDWCKAHNTEKYTLKEAAILFESGSYKHVNLVIGVIAPEAVRITRTMQRDGISRDEVLARIQKQIPTQELIKRCDYILENDGEKSVVEQVLKLHSLFLKIGNK